MAMKKMSREEMLARTRKKMQERSQGRRDPDEFRCPLAKGDETLEYYFKVLPAIEPGDVIKGGQECENGSPDGLWYYENGSHFFNRTRYECPRCHDSDPCPMCQFGFDLMKDSQDKDFRRRVSSTYLARSYYAVNIYFLQNKKNPEAVRGRVFWYNAPKTVWDIWDACIQSDDPGDPEDPQACGLFFYPWDSTYTFKLVATRKGDYNTYETSKFLPATLGPLVALKDKEPDEEAIERILKERHYLPSKFSERNVEKLEELLKIINNKDQNSGMTNIQTKKKSAADTSNETIEEELKPAPKKAPPKKEEVVEEEVEEEAMEEEIKETKKKPKSKPVEELEDETIEESNEKPSEETEDADEDAELQGLLQTLDDEDE